MTSTLTRRYRWIVLHAPIPLSQAASAPLLLQLPLQRKGDKTINNWNKLQLGLRQTSFLDYNGVNSLFMSTIQAAHGSPENAQVTF